MRWWLCVAAVRPNYNKKTWRCGAKSGIFVWEIGLNYQGSLFSLKMTAVGDEEGLHAAKNHYAFFDSVIIHFKPACLH